jgi:hypothetical protein
MNGYGAPNEPVRETALGVRRVCPVPSGVMGFGIWDFA